MGKHFFSAIVDQIIFIFVSRFCKFCAFTRPRYQVSVYRTIVLWLVIKVIVFSAILSRVCMFCAYARPRYHVSVYSTIAPLILLTHLLFMASAHSRVQYRSSVFRPSIQ